ncbi:MAG: efflux RND transporter permease subunit [Bacteroidetes bacterium]|nr:efflux RND transporter permease subunit [Bacteroidota bacterium]
MEPKRFNLIEKAMRNNNIVVIIVMAIIIVGVIALLKMPRNEFPQFTIRQGVIVGVYPGATSAEVEKQLTSVVENYLFSYQEVKKAKTYSWSREGMMYIFVELNDDVKNADQFWSKLKHGLSELKMTLPAGVAALIANSDFGDTSALLITLSSDTKSYKELEEQLRRLESECRKIPATSKIKHFGLQKEKIFVNVKPELLNEYNIKSLTLLGSYQANGMVSYAGKLDDGRSVMPVHFPPNFESEKDLAEQIVYSDPDGNVVRLKNIATIERKYDKPDNFIRQNGKKTILLSLEMQPGNNIVAYGRDVDKVLGNFKKHLPAGIEIAKISELPKYVSDSVNNFLKEFLIAIVAVILVTLILLPLRVASVAGITVPISVMITLAILYFNGIELHTVSLASLILVLGMIVDNSIVVIDNHVAKIDMGFSPWHAAIKSARELVAPIIVATLAILAAYIPLAYMVPGTAGEFMNTIPWVVTIALSVSVLVALFLVPYLNFVFIKKGLKNVNKPGKKSFLDILQAWFDTSLDMAFRHPRLVIAIGIAFVILAVGLFQLTDQQLFPEMERNQFAVEVYLPTGSSLKVTEKVVDSLEAILLKDKRVTNVTTFIGTSSPRFHTVYAPQMPASNFGQLLVNTKSEKATRAIVNEYSPRYSDNFINAHVKWKVLALQLNKASIEVRISSDSVKDIRSTEKKVMEILAKTKGIAWVRTDWDQPRQNINVNLDRDKSNRMGYFKSLVATSVMIGLDGVPLTTIWEDDYPVDVVLKQDQSSTQNIKTLEDQYITSPMSFSAIPLRSMASFTPSWSEGTIVRRNGVPTLTVMVDNEQKAVAATILGHIKPQIEKLKLPEGTSISWGGDYEAMEEVFIPMGIALGVSILLIFFILLIQFRKAKLAILIMSGMLLTLPGAAIGILIMHYPFSVTAFIGITSLCGMVVRNGIILIDYARELHEKQGMSIKEAAIAAGKRRMRPIFLTSAAAGVGVVPMIISRSPLWGPLGTVIFFGLMFSMVLTLYIMPVLYSVSYSDKDKKLPFWTIPGSVKMLLIVFILMTPLLMGVSQAKAQAGASQSQAAVSTSQAKAQPPTPNPQPPNPNPRNVTLDSCRQLALQNNHKMKEAELQVRAAGQQKMEVFTNFFPSVSAAAFALRSYDYLMKIKTPEMNLPVWDGKDPRQLINPTQFTYVPSLSLNLLNYLNTAAVTVTLPVYAGGRIRRGYKLARLGEDVSGYQKEMTREEVLARTEELFWTLQSLSEKGKTIISYQHMLDSLYRDVNNYSNAGLAQKNDVLKVQLKQNELRTSMLKLKNGVNLTRRALCQHIGLPYDSSLVFTYAPDPTLANLTYQDPEQLVKNRSEYQLLNKAVEVKQVQKKMAAGQYMPQLALVGAGFTYDIMNTTSNNALGMLSLSVPITDWWAGSHRIKKQQLEVEQAQSSLEENTELLVLQIRQAANEVEESRYQISVSQLSAEQAVENLRISHDNFKAGVIGISDLLEAQAVLQQAKDNLIEAQCQFQSKLAKYKLMTGG